MDSFDQARFNMIQQQIRPWNLDDERVLETLSAVAREAFVPEAYRGLAYADLEIPLGGGQCMLAPRVAAHLLQALRLAPSDRVLEIGTGRGYLTACLERLAGQVISLEIDPELASQARHSLQSRRSPRLDLRTGDGLSGPVEGGPFDAIAVTGSLPDEGPLDGLKAQLAAGGRLFAIVGQEPAMTALLITRTADGFARRHLFETCAPPLVNSPEPEAFVF